MSLTMLYLKQKASAFLKSDAFAELRRWWTQDLCICLCVGVIIGLLFKLGVRTLQEPNDAGFLQTYSLASALMCLSGIGLVIRNIARCKKLARMFGRTAWFWGVCLLAYDFAVLAALIYGGWVVRYLPMPKFII